MRIKELFNFFIEAGIEKDPRGKDFVLSLLAENKQKHSKLSEEEKQDYDSEKLSNPFLDSRVLFGDKSAEVKSIMVGIDIETPELLLANTLRANGRVIDLVITHHPEGVAYATFYRVMEMQADILHKFGVPINIAEPLVDSRLKEVGRKVMPQNHLRSVDAAKLLGIPFMSAHTVADNHVATHLQSIFDKIPHKTLGDIVKTLEAMPEYKDAKINGAGPRIVNGSKESRTGKIFVDMTGGTEGPKEVIEKLSAAGVGTIVGMHMSEDHLKELKKHNINLVIAGHISSDNLGLNLMLDDAEAKFGRIETVECSGFRRFRRN